MSNQIQAEIISIGTEILRGEITDTNSGYLASELPMLGIQLLRISTVGDDIGHLCQVLQQALSRAELVIATGGLGPTQDDLTRNCIASVLGEELVADPALGEQLRRYFSRMGRDMPSNNMQQTMLIPSAEPLPNPRGTAPGWWVEKDGKAIVAMPGPPREMMPMWKNEVVPRLKSRFPIEAILSRTVKTFSIGEANVSELVQPLFESSTPSVGIYSKSDGIHVRLFTQGDDAVRILDEAESRLEALLAPYVWGKDEESLPFLVSGWLSKHGLTLATMEDGSGGLLANAITGVARNLECYRGGLVAATSEAKITCGVPAEIIAKHGVISSEVAEAMALAVRERLAADFGLSVTGITTAENAEGKPPGLAYIGVADVKGSQTWQQSYPPSRGDAGDRLAIAALFRLRERLIGLNFSG